MTKTLIQFKITSDRSLNTDSGDTYLTGLVPYILELCCLLYRESAACKIREAYSRQKYPISLMN